LFVMGRTWMVQGFLNVVLHSVALSKKKQKHPSSSPISVPSATTTLLRSTEYNFLFSAQAVQSSSHY
jgi:hypothetical protein